MPDSVGMDRFTGRRLTDWEHTAQSIGIILTTPKFTRVMRRLFGCDAADLVDAPMTERVILAAYVATAEALEPRLVEGRQYGEPRFRLAWCRIADAAASGAISLVMGGVYYPRGHLGDFTPDATRTLTVDLGLKRVQITPP